ncbi:C-type lectin domain family 4 member F-like [Drosophila subpulchrella]|uniref:C-type lectin domain family 4 member F-like n=1 Tax=Drosophila subpulchrella TaxID=1486046 RepID=UPI0018A174C9|nr:C-type lectin domain family 4 member F-like [Drosophila subpulchrella]
MYKLTAILVISLITGNLNGSQSEDLETRCGNHFFSRFRPVMNFIIDQQESANRTRDERHQMQIQLASVQEAFTSAKASLDSKDLRLEKLESQQIIAQDVVDKLGGTEYHLTGIENLLVSMQNKMDINFSAVKETQAQQAALQEAVNIRLQRMEESLKELIRQVPIRFDLERPLENIMHMLRLIMNYRKVQSRYFFILESVKSYSDAEKYCVDKGGHLATFENDEELNAIIAMVNHGDRYWLGVNDKAISGEFVSVDTGKKVSYLKWSPGEPDYWNDNMHCVVLFQGAMRVNECNHGRYFICQAGNEMYLKETNHLS